MPATDDTAYHDAQIADYDTTQRDFRWRPTPARAVRLSLRAQFSGDVRGTAGFGFWNHPFSPDMRGLPRPPQAAWFFYGSPPNDMPLALGVPGHGWKAATISAARWPFWELVPFALPGMALMRIPAVYRWLWPVGQAALAVRETALPLALMYEPTEYTITWGVGQVTFRVNSEIVLISPFRLGAPMGFIAWVDNQYAVVTPWGRFGWGLVDVPGVQSLRLWDIVLQRGAN